MFVNLGDLRFILFNKCTVMQLAARAMQNIYRDSIFVMLC